MLGLPDRLASKIEPELTSGCWLWTDAQSRDGYGRVRWPTGAKSSPQVQAHRVVYMALVGPIPDAVA